MYSTEELLTKPIETATQVRVGSDAFRFKGGFVRCQRQVLPSTGDITPSTFRAEKVAHHLQAGRGEVVVQVLLLSLDPAMRGWISDTRTYMTPVQIGETYDLVTS